MNLLIRNRIIGIAVAIAICLGSASTVLADPAPASTPLVVTIHDAGIFSISLGTVTSFAPGSVSATTGSVLSTTVVLRYDDTRAYRSQFHVDLKASKFTSLKRIPYAGPTDFYSIPASNLSLVKNFKPVQALSSADTPGVGDISATNQSGTSIGSAASVVWTADNTLEIPRKIAQGLAGSGTYLSGQGIQLSLNVPPAIPATFYNSKLTATVTYETP